MEDFQRFASRSLLLTYPKCPLGHGFIIPHIEEICEEKGWTIANWAACDEKHRDDSDHSHVALLFSSKVQCVCDDRFDVSDGDTWYHPNWKVGKSRDAWKKLVWYVQKSGTWAMMKTEFPCDPRNYVKTKKDFQEWQADAKRLHMAGSFPIILPGGAEIKAPAGQDRKAIILVHGPPNTGKSTWRKKLKNYYLAQPDIRYPFEDYKGEQVIVFDDWEGEGRKISSTMLIKITEYEDREVSVGPARYKTVYWPPKQQRVCVVVCNKVPECFSEDRIKTRILATVEFKL